MLDRGIASLTIGSGRVPGSRRSLCQRFRWRIAGADAFILSIHNARRASPASSIQGATGVVPDLGDIANAELDPSPRLLHVGATDVPEPKERVGREAHPNLVLTDIWISRPRRPMTKEHKEAVPRPSHATASDANSSMRQTLTRFGRRPQGQDQLPREGARSKTSGLLRVRSF